MKRVRAACGRFDNWWFGSSSPAALCLLRVFLGACAILSLVITLFVFNDFFTPDGYMPGTMVQKWLQYDSNIVWKDTPFQFHLPFELPRLTLLFGDPPASLTLTVYILTLVAAIFFTLGLWTRVAGFALVTGLLSLQTRTPLIIHSGDSLLRLSLMYMVLSPCGAVYSLDWLRRRDKPVSPMRVTSQRLIQYQVAMVYLFTAWWKFFGTYWMDGTATWYPPQMHEFQRFWLPAFLDRQPFVGITTYATLAVEVLLGTLVFWKPARKWILISGLAMHAYIEYHYNIPMFAFIITSCYIVFYEGDEVEAWVSKMKVKLLKGRNPSELSTESQTPA